MDSDKLSSLYKEGECERVFGEYSDKVKEKLPFPHVIIDNYYYITSNDKFLTTSLKDIDHFLNDINNNNGEIYLIYDSGERVDSINFVVRLVIISNDHDCYEELMDIYSKHMEKIRSEKIDKLL